MSVDRDREHLKSLEQARETAWRSYVDGGGYMPVVAIDKEIAAVRKKIIAKMIEP